MRCCDKRWPLRLSRHARECLSKPFHLEGCQAPAAANFVHEVSEELAELWVVLRDSPSVEAPSRHCEPLGEHLGPSSHNIVYGDQRRDGIVETAASQVCERFGVRLVLHQLASLTPGHVKHLVQIGKTRLE